MDKVERESEVSSENLGIMANTGSGSNLRRTENTWHCDIELCAASKNYHPMIEEGGRSWRQLYVCSIDGSNSHEEFSGEMKPMPRTNVEAPHKAGYGNGISGIPIGCEAGVWLEGAV